jgi:hypothetical protein
MGVWALSGHSLLHGQLPARMKRSPLSNLTRLVSVAASIHRKPIHWQVHGTPMTRPAIIAFDLDGTIWCDATLLHRKIGQTRLLLVLVVLFFT